MKYLLGVFLFTSCLMLSSWKPESPLILKEKPPKGKKVYDKICTNCHMADAKGVLPFVPALSRSKLVLGPSTKLIRIVLRGSDELKNDPARNYKNEMPPHDDLTDKKIANVLTYIRKNFGNNAPPVTVDEVKLIRANL